MNPCAGELKLTIFVADHSGICQNRDDKEGKITQRENMNQCANE